MKKTITGIMIAKAVSVLGVAAILGLLIAHLFGLVEANPPILLALLLPNISAMALAFSRKG